jgi:outer membrane protein TolC
MPTGIFPQINIPVITAIWQYTALSNFLSPASAIYTVAVALARPIFEGGRLHGQLDYSKGRYQELADRIKEIM